MSSDSSQPPADSEIAEPPQDPADSLVSITEPNSPQSSDDEDDGPVVYYALSCSIGFIGVFNSIEQTRDIVQLYPSVKFIAHKYCSAPGDKDVVWVVIYKHTDSVAFVSNDRADAERVHNAYLSVGLVYDDSIDCWRRRVNFISDLNTEKLHDLEFPLSDEERTKKYADNNALILHIKKAAAGVVTLDFDDEPEFSILDCIEPIDCIKAVD